jgi:anti-sigma factor RsiW
MTHEDCRIWEPLLARAADGVLQPDEQADLDRHLSGCASCRGAVADQRAVRQVLQARPAATASAAFAATVMSAVAREGLWLRRLDFRRWTWRLVPATAALLLAAWTVLPEPAGTSPPLISEDLPVSAALWQESLNDTAVLSLMVWAGPDDPLAEAYREQ